MNIVITGSTKGIGSGLAEEFLKLNHRVLINGRTENSTREKCQFFKQKYPDTNCLYYACDVRIYDSVAAMYDYAAEQLGGIDIWINNAGMNQNHQSIYEYDVKSMDLIVEVNIKGMLNGTRIACEKMKDKGGYIYNMEGFGSNNMKADKMSLYGMTKRALTYFTESAAIEMKETPVKVCRLSPGMVITDLLLSQIPENKDEKEKLFKIFNILGDRVETVTPWLVKKILLNKKNNIRIAWLTNLKVFKRFLSHRFTKRRIL